MIHPAYAQDRLLKAARWAGAKLFWRRGLNASGQPGWWRAELSDGSTYSGGDPRSLAETLERYAKQRGAA